MVTVFHVIFKGLESLEQFFSSSWNIAKGQTFFYNGDTRNIDINHDVIVDSVNGSLAERFPGVELAIDGTPIPIEEAIPSGAICTLSYCYASQDFHLLVSNESNPDLAISELLLHKSDELELEEIDTLAECIMNSANCDEPFADKIASYLLDVKADLGGTRGGTNHYYTEDMSKVSSTNDYFDKFKAMPEDVQRAVFRRLIGSVSDASVINEVFQDIKFKVSLTKADGGYELVVNTDEKKAEKPILKYNTKRATTVNKMIWALVSTLYVDGMLTQKHQGVSFGYSSRRDLLTCMYKIWAEQKDKDGLIREIRFGEEIINLEARWNAKEEEYKAAGITDLIAKMAKSGNVDSYINLLSFASQNAEKEHNYNNATQGKKEAASEAQIGYAEEEIDQIVLLLEGDESLGQEKDTLFEKLVKKLLVLSPNRSILHKVYDCVCPKKKSKDEEKESLYAKHHEEEFYANLLRIDTVRGLEDDVRINAEGGAKRQYDRYETIFYKHFLKSRDAVFSKNEGKKDYSSPQLLSKTKKIYNTVLASSVDTSSLELHQLYTVVKDVAGNDIYTDKGSYVNIVVDKESEVSEELLKIIGKKAADGEWVSKLEHTKPDFGLVL